MIAAVSNPIADIRGHIESIQDIVQHFAEREAAYESLFAEVQSLRQWSKSVAAELEQTKTERDEFRVNFDRTKAEAEEIMRASESLSHRLEQEHAASSEVRAKLMQERDDYRTKVGQLERELHREQERFSEAFGLADQEITSLQKKIEELEHPKRERTSWKEAFQQSGNS